MLNNVVYEKNIGDICKVRAITLEDGEWYFMADICNELDASTAEAYRLRDIDRKVIRVYIHKNIVVTLNGFKEFCKRKACRSEKASQMLAFLNTLVEEKPYVKVREPIIEEKKAIEESGLVVFKNGDFSQLRTMEVNGEPWFVGKDVAEALGYSNPSKAVIDHVDEEDKKVVMLDFQADSQNGNVPLGKTKTTFINESGMYSLILSSKLPSAKKFKRWVTSEVIPSIRKNGVYVDDSRVNDLVKNQDELIKVNQILTEQMILLTDRITALEAEKKSIAETTPQIALAGQKRKSYKELMDERNYPVNITTIAKDFGHEPAELNFILCKAGIQYKYGKTYYPTDMYAGQGIMKEIQYKNKANGDVVVYTRWTREGNDLIREKVMNELGWTPLCESAVG